MVRISSVDFLNDVSDDKLTLGFFVICCLPSCGAEVKNALIFASSLLYNFMVCLGTETTLTAVSLIRMK